MLNGRIIPLSDSLRPPKESKPKSHRNQFYDNLFAGRGGFVPLKYTGLTDIKDLASRVSAARKHRPGEWRVLVRVHPAHGIGVAVYPVEPETTDTLN